MFFPQPRNSASGCFLLIVLLACPLRLWADSNPGDPGEPLFHLQYLDLQKQPDGTVTQDFRIIGFSGPPEDIRAFYRMAPAPELYRADITKGRFRICSNHPQLFRVLVLAGDSGKGYTAATDLMLFWKIKPES